MIKLGAQMAATSVDTKMDGDYKFHMRRKTVWLISESLHVDSEVEKLRA